MATRIGISIMGKSGMQWMRSVGREGVNECDIHTQNIQMF